MKLFIATILIFGALAYAELPSNGIKDIPTRETTEYLDGKIDNINKSFVDNRSTATFAGWVDIGLEIMTDGGNVENDSVSCSGGKRVIGGGCYTASAVYTSYPETSVKWTCRTAVAQSIEAYAICARVK